VGNQKGNEGLEAYPPETADADLSPSMSRKLLAPTLRAQLLFIDGTFPASWAYSALQRRAVRREDFFESLQSKDDGEHTGYEQEECETGDCVAVHCSAAAPRR
jgi:hypothetical protein